VRVAVVNHHLRDVLGGSELQCDLVARGLTARGHDVSYLAVDGAPAPAGTGESSYRTLPVPSDPSELAAAVVATRSEVVYWRFNRRGLRETARALREAGIPLVVALAHVDDVTPWPSWPWPAGDATFRDRASDLRSRLRWRRQLAAFDHVTAIASQRLDLIGRIPHQKVALQRHVPNIMDPAAEPFVWPRSYVAWVGNLKPRKRPELIPRIADALVRHDIDLVVAGPAQDERYHWLTGPLREHPNLHHVGTLTPVQVTGLLAGARCLAVTAMPEGFSNVMIQAWWGGTPTVTLDYDPDGMVAGEGLGAVAGGDGAADVERFLAHVVRFSIEERDRSSAGQRPGLFARERFGEAAVLAALEGLLEEAVSSPSVRK
jgi:glycosyltransferase involved in cell wall biosynthesis